MPLSRREKRSLVGTHGFDLSASAAVSLLACLSLALVSADVMIHMLPAWIGMLHTDNMPAKSPRRIGGGGLKGKLCPGGMVQRRCAWMFRHASSLTPTVDVEDDILEQYPV